MTSSEGAAAELAAVSSPLHEDAAHSGSAGKFIILPIAPPAAPARTLAVPASRVVRRAPGVVSDGRCRCCPPNTESRARAGPGAQRPGRSPARGWGATAEPPPVAGERGPRGPARIYPGRLEGG